MQSFLSNPQNLNTYSYAVNNPLKYTDANGELPILIPLLIVASEVGFSAWDAYDAGNAWFGENSSNSNRAWAGGALAAGLILPGPGKAYTKPAQYIAKEFLTSQSEINRIIKSADNAFEEAINGGKHAGSLKNYFQRSVSELEKAVKGFENRIKDHIQKLNDPFKFEDFMKGTDQYRNGLIEKWKQEIKNFQEQKNIFEEIINIKK